MERIRHSGASILEAAKAAVETAIDTHLYPRRITVPINSMTFELDVRSRKEEVDAKNLEGHGPVIKQVLDTIPSGGVFWDTDPGIGIWAVPIAMKVGHIGRVLAFEPDEILSARLQANLDINCCPISGEVVRKAAWECCGEIDTPNGGCVPCVALSHCILNEGRRMPDIVKIGSRVPGENIIRGMGGIVWPEYIVYGQELSLDQEIPALLQTEYHPHCDPFVVASETVHVFRRNESLWIIQHRQPQA